MRPRVITWPVQSTTSIAALQTLGAAGKVTLNGSLVLPGANIPPIVFPGYTRSITITSLNNLSGVNFTINGVLNNAPLSEILVGPDHDTVTSANIYDAITSITTSAAAAAFSVGTGENGRTRWINFDYDMLVPNYSVSVAYTATVSYTLNVTLDDPNVVAVPTVFTPVSAMTAASSSQFASLTNPINYMNITINSSDATGALVVTFLQQGIAS